MCTECESGPNKHSPGLLGRWLKKTRSTQAFIVERQVNNYWHRKMEEHYAQAGLGLEIEMTD